MDIGLPSGVWRRAAGVLAGLALWLGLGSGSAWGQDGAAWYFGLQVPATPPVTVYGQMLGRELRLATSTAGLATARPVRARRVTTYGYMEFPITKLPLTANQLPAGCVGMRATFSGYRNWLGSPPITALVDVDRRGTGTTVWSCRLDLYLTAFEVVDNIEIVDIPFPEAVTMYLSLATSKAAGREAKATATGKLGIAVSVGAGETSVNGILKSRQSVPVQIRIRDASTGRVVKTVRRPLSGLGFT